MRKLATNELRLLALFSAAVFLALNLFAAKAWLRHRGDLIGQIAAARGEEAEARSWIGGAEAIRSARAWLETHPPPENTADQSSTRLLQIVRAAAEENGLKVIEENLLPAAELATGHAAALEFKLSGPFPGVAKFLFALQSPAAWRAVDKMIVRSDAEPPNVLADMKIRQYYRPPAPVPTAPNP